MRDFVRAQKDGLAHEVKEGGSNLSVGQRQVWIFFQNTTYLFIKLRHMRPRRVAAT